MQTKLQKNLGGAACVSLTMLAMACSSDPATQTTTDPLGSCSTALNWEIWVPRQTANDIKIVEGPTFANSNVTIDLAPTGLKLAHGVAFNKDGTRAAVAMLGTPEARYADGGVVIVDVATRAIISSIITRAKTHQVAWAPNGTEIWTTNVNAPGKIVFVDVATATTTGALELGGQAVATRFSKDGTKAYITNQQVENDASWVNVVDVATKAIDGAPYKTGKTTVTPALTSDGKALFVTNGMSNTWEKIDVTMADRAAAVSVFASGLEESHAVALAENHVIVTARMGKRIVFFDRDGAEVKNVPITATMGDAIPDMVTLSPDCRNAYMTERADGKLVRLDVLTQEIKGSIDLGGGYTHGVSVVKRPDPSM